MADVLLPPLREGDGLLDSPSFRENLATHERSVTDMANFVKTLVKEMNSFMDASQAASSRQVTIANLLKSWKFSRVLNEFYSDDDRLIDTSFGVFADALLEVERLQTSMLQQMSSIVTDIDLVRKQKLGGLKDAATAFKKSSDAYYATEEKTLAYSSEKDETMLAQSDVTLSTERKTFQHDTITYVHSLKSQRKRARLSLADQVTRFTQTISVNLKTAHEAITARAGSIFQRLTQATCALAMECEIAGEEESRVLTEYFCPKSTDMPTETLHTKQGYLHYRSPQPTFFKNWQRHYMVYTRSTRTLKGTLFKDEEIYVDRCTQMLTNITERRFCFEVLSGDKSYLFQARNEAERGAWMAAMGGMKPMKTIRKKKEKGFQDFSVGRGITSQKVSLLQKTMLVIELRHLQVEGIYRISGQHTKIQRLLSEILERNKDYDLHEEDSAVLSGAIKQIFRDLPDPIFPYDLYDPLVAINGLPDVNSQVAAFRDILQSTDFPVVNYEVLKMLFRHLRMVAAESERNKMSATNLGLVIGPTLLRCKESLAVVSDIRACTNIVELGIVHYAEIFEDAPPPTTAPPNRSMSNQPLPTIPDTQTLPDHVYESANMLNRTNDITMGQAVYDTPIVVPQSRTSGSAGAGAAGAGAGASASGAGAGAGVVAAGRTLTSGNTNVVVFESPSASDNNRTSPSPFGNRPPVPPRVRTPKRIKVWRGLFDCQGADESELTFLKGDVIDNVEESTDDGWMTGRVQRTGQFGMFPANYCEETET